MTIAGATPVFVATAVTLHQLSPRALEKAVTPATEAVILNTPNNPTGVVYGVDALRAVAELASDGTSGLSSTSVIRSWREGAIHHSIVQLLPELKSQTVMANSFSKSHAVTGWRLGYACAPAPVIAAMENLQGHTTSNSSTLAQHAAAAALRDDPEEFIQRVNLVLAQRLSTAITMLDTIEGVQCAPAAGALPCFLTCMPNSGHAIAAEGGSTPTLFAS